jgi:hypothetical protein
MYVSWELDETCCYHMKSRHIGHDSGFSTGTESLG